MGGRRYVKEKIDEIARPTLYTMVEENNILNSIYCSFIRLT